MTDTPAPSITEAFWAQRDADKELIASMLRQTADKIQELGGSDFYRDGLPSNMQNTLQTVLALSNQLNPPAPPGMIDPLTGHPLAVAPPV